MTTKKITLPIVYSGRYCDENVCRMFLEMDERDPPRCAAYGSLKQTRGDIDRATPRWPRSIRHPRCVKDAHS